MAAITTAASIKAKLGITETGFDTVIAALIAAAIAFVEAQADVSLTGEDTEYTEYFDESPVIFKNPVSSITSVKIWNGSTYETVDTTAYRLLSDSTLDYEFTPGLDRVQVVYVGGAQPADLKELVERIVMRQFRKMEHEGESSTAFEASTTQWDKIVDDFDQSVLDNYRPWI